MQGHFLKATLTDNIKFKPVREKSLKQERKSEREYVSVGKRKMF